MWVKVSNRYATEPHKVTKQRTSLSNLNHCMKDQQEYTPHPGTLGHVDRPAENLCVLPKHSRHQSSAACHATSTTGMHRGQMRISSWTTTHSLRHKFMTTVKQMLTNISCNKYMTEPSAGLWLCMTTTLRSWQKKLAEEAEYNLFHNSCSENHCLRHIYTVNEKPGAMRLRTRGHDFTLPFVK